MRKARPVTGELFYFPERFRSCNVYLMDFGDRLVLLDPSLEADQIELDRPLAFYLASHAHYDHIGALSSWKKAWPQSLFLMHEGDVDMLDDPAVNASKFFGRPASFPKPDRCLQGGELLEVNDRYVIQVIHTPGHTMGSSCFLVLKKEEEDRVPLALLTGDTLFDRAWGRTDFVTGDDRLMRKSLEGLYTLMAGLPPDLPVCPGHASLTTAGAACRFLKTAGFAP